MKARYELAACAAGVLSLTTPSVDAQVGGADASAYVPTTPGDAAFAVQGPRTGGHLDPAAVVGLGYVGDPVVVQDGDALVSDAFSLRVGARLSLWSRLAASVDVPAVLHQSGDDPTLGGTTLTSPSGAEMGDIRLGLRGRLFGEPDGALSLGAGTYVHLPTSPDGSFFGEDATAVTPYLSAGGRFGSLPFDYVANGGIKLRTAESSSHAVIYGASLGWLASDRIRLGPEVFFSSALTPEDILGPGVTTDAALAAEVMLSGRARVWEGLHLGLASSVGLTGAVGTPAFRQLLEVTWALPEPVSEERPDADGDGIEDEVDACPQRAGVESDDERKHGCPPPDRDGDGISDARDACLEVPGPESADPSLHGCPRDRDGDGITDLADACVDVPGERSMDPEKSGCPAPKDPDGDGIAARDACPDTFGAPSDDPALNGCPQSDGRDRDGDGISNDRDACPDRAGPENTDPSRHGCPIVMVTESEIVINKQIQFVFGRSGIQDTVSPVSSELLSEVRNVIAEHPEIRVIEVQGHTDNVGGPAINAQLSQARAESVKLWLIDNGVPAAKLRARGYGASQPVADNDTDEGRQKNRRVGFVIIERDPE